MFSLSSLIFIILFDKGLSKQGISLEAFIKQNKKWDILMENLDFCNSIWHTYFVLLVCCCICIDKLLHE